MTDGRVSGNPPSTDECVLVETLPWPKFGKTGLNPSDWAFTLAQKPVPFRGYLRLTYQEYKDILPIKMVVPGHGLLRLGREGWAIG